MEQDLAKRLSQFTNKELQNLAKKAGLKNYSTLNKAELTNKISGIDPSVLKKYLTEKQVKNLGLIFQIDDLVRRLNIFSFATTSTSMTTDTTVITTSKKKNNTPIPSSLKKEDFVIQVNNHKTSKGEDLCRELLEEMYPNKKFPPVKCNVIRFPDSNRSIEIDCFNYEVGIALEFQGKQHYEYVEKFHKSPEDYEKQAKRDKFKKESLDKHFVFIAVPYTCKTREQIKSFILNSIPDKKKPKPETNHYCVIL